jgi:hypothetical protein
MDKMDKNFTLYEESFALKELGFDEPCFWWYDFEKELRKDRIGVNSINSKDFLNGSSCSAPLYSQAFRWLYKQLGRDGFGVMPIDTDKCNEELRKLIEIVKEITPHNHE